MGAIVTVKVPAGMPLDGVKNAIQKAISSATGESVTVVINAVSQLQRRKVTGIETTIGIPQTIQGQGVTVPNSIPGSY